MAKKPIAQAEPSEETRRRVERLSGGGEKLKAAQIVAEQAEEERDALLAAFPELREIVAGLAR